MGAKQEELVGSTYHWFWLQLPFALAPPSGSLPTFYPISSIERQPIGHLEMPPCYRYAICDLLISCFLQVLSGFGESDFVQIPLLVCPLPDFYDRDNKDQHLLCGLPPGLFLLHAFWAKPPVEASQRHTQTVGLFDRVHSFGYSREEPPCRMYLSS